MGKTKKIIASMLSTIMLVSAFSVDVYAVVNNDFLISEIPASYNAVTEGYVTSVKSQDQAKTSWAFAALSAAESSLIKRNNVDKNSIDLSELHMSYFGTDYAYDKLEMLTGDKTTFSDDKLLYPFISLYAPAHTATYILANNIGAVDEMTTPKFSSENANINFNCYETDRAYSENAYRLKNAYWLNMSDISKVKEYIIEYGSGNTEFNFYYDEEYNNPYYNNEKFSYYTPTSGSDLKPNQGISLVGWDDNYPKENFISSVKPVSNGAWLVKNSYSSNWGDNGYFWISYEDNSLVNNIVCFYELIKADESTCYQYDGTSLKESYNGGLSTSTAYAANVFTCQKSTNLKEIGFYTYHENINYEIKVFKNVKDAPDSGELLATLSGACDVPGYHTVSLDKKLNIKYGEKFSVIIKYYTNDDRKIDIPCDYTKTVEDIHYENTTLPCQSYFKSDFTKWKDVSQDGYNFRIKAIADDVKVESFNIVPTSVNMKINEILELETIISPETACNSDMIWYSEDPSIADVNQNGSVIAISSGKTVIHAQNEDETIFQSCNVNVSSTEIVFDPISEKNFDESTLSIKELTMLSLDEVEKTILGQVVYSYSEKSNGDKVNIILEDIENDNVYGILIQDKTNYEMFQLGDVVKVTGKVKAYNRTASMTSITNVEVIERYNTLIDPIYLTLEELLSNKDLYQNKYVVIKDVVLGEYVEDSTISISSGKLKFEIYNGAYYPQNVTTGYTVDLYCAIEKIGDKFYARVGSEYDYYNENQSPIDKNESNLFVQIDDVKALTYDSAILISVDDMFISNEIVSHNFSTKKLDTSSAIIENDDKSIIWYLEKAGDKLYLRNKSDNKYYCYSSSVSGTKAFDIPSEDCIVKLVVEDEKVYLVSDKGNMYLSTYVDDGETYLRWQSLKGKNTASLTFYNQYNKNVPSVDPNEELWDIKVIDKEYLIGDIDLNESVAMTDVTTLQRYIASMIEFESVQNIVADVNFDDEISMIDVTTIQQFIASIIDELPAGKSINIPEIIGNPLYVKAQIQNIIEYIDNNKDEIFNNINQQYTDESYQKFETAYETALQLLSDDDASYDELTYAYNSLMISMNSLVINVERFDRESLIISLNDALESYGSVKISDGPYTNESFEIYENALIAAFDAAADVEDLSNEMIYEIITNLTDAYNYLVLDLASMDKEQLIAYINSIIPDYEIYIENKDMFTSESFVNFEKAYNNLISVINNSENIDVSVIYAAYYYMSDMAELLEFAN